MKPVEPQHQLYMTMEDYKKAKVIEDSLEQKNGFYAANGWISSQMVW